VERIRRTVQIFFSFFRLGLTAFGGPVAHIGYFHQDFVIRRKWIEERLFGDVVALCQILPGPASSQVGISIGLLRAGIPGALAAWIGFTLPSALVLAIAGMGFSFFYADINPGVIHGLKLVAVAVVAQALSLMFVRLCPDRTRIAIASLSVIVLAWSRQPWSPIAVILCAGVCGFFLLRSAPDDDVISPEIPIGKKTGAMCLALLASLLLCLPLISPKTGSSSLLMFDGFFRAGSLVFGGGHVVLPLLQAEVVPRMISNDTFIAGYGLAQAIPGPLFTFSAFLGSASQVAPAGWQGAALCLAASFLPSFLLVFGVTPFWTNLRKDARFRGCISGINASVVGLLLSAFYNPVWTTAVHTGGDFALVCAALALLVFWKVAPWLIVVGMALSCGVIASWI